MSTDYRPEGTPLPAKPDHTVDYARDRGRKFVPAKGGKQVDIFNNAPQSAADERVRNVQRGQYADFHRRRFGRAITEAEYPAGLRNEGRQQ